MSHLPGEKNNSSNRYLEIEEISTFKNSRDFRCFRFRYLDAMNHFSLGKRLTRSTYERPLLLAYVCIYSARDYRVYRYVTQVKQLLVPTSI